METNDSSSEIPDAAQAGGGVPVETDVDRGAWVGATIGITMFVLFQGFILAAFQTPVIGGDTPAFAPLRFAGVSQLIYVFPTVLFFINRRCPRMAVGFLIVAGAVFVGSIVSLAFL